MAAKKKIPLPKPSFDRPWADLTIAQKNLLYTRALHAYSTGKGPNPSTRPEFFRAKAAGN
jgi:hypothetical protein